MLKCTHINIHTKITYEAILMDKMLPSLKLNLSSKVQIMAEADNVSLYSNALKESILDKW